LASGPYWSGSSEAAARLALKASSALARVRQNPREAGISGKSGRVTPSGRPPQEEADSEIEAQCSSLGCIR